MEALAARLHAEMEVARTAAEVRQQALEARRESERRALAAEVASLDGTHARAEKERLAMHMQQQTRDMHMEALLAIERESARRATGEVESLESEVERSKATIKQGLHQAGFHERQAPPPRANEHALTDCVLIAC